jgi:NADPH:quinone reductase
MKAWQCGMTPGREDMRLTDLPEPSTASDDVLIDIHATAVNFSDLLMAEDKYQVKPPRPFVPGQEIAGVVVSAPKGAGFAPGDRVMSKVTSGGFAERISVPAHMPIAIPENLSFVQAAAMPVAYITAMVGLSECSTVNPGDWVLVHAASGATGLAALEVAVAMGARVIAAASSPDKRAIAAAHGAEVLIDYTAADWVAEVKDATGGAGARIIFDPVGGDVGEANLRAIARDGTILIVGFASGRIQALAANRLMLKRAAARGVSWNHDLDADMLARCNQRIMAMLQKGQLSPEISVYPGLTALPQALDDLAARRSTGKLVLDLKAG